MMINDQDHEGAPVARDELCDLSEELLRALEAEPVPEPIQILARRLALALRMQAGAEPVLLPGSDVREEQDI
ncbi:hypothetical protein D1122_03065 [Cereibacter sphaeroides]|uniref:hypothetical protein n=1 Tax=Cereibacter sphaeroides TaxID=1063 RepID=UPI000E5A6908|nr:hypothetical protein [Cereibacter sphaeroides]RIA00644.1 hypothetical protein D1122_03065 [Cereibacter sphaeroides]